MLNHDWTKSYRANILVVLANLTPRFVLKSASCAVMFHLKFDSINDKFLTFLLLRKVFPCVLRFLSAGMKDGS